MKKNRIEWKSFVLGLIVCFTLIIVLSTIKPLISAPQSKSAQKNTGMQGVTAQNNPLQNIENRLVNIEAKLQSLQGKGDTLYNDLHAMWADVCKTVVEHCKK